MEHAAFTKTGRFMDLAIFLDKSLKEHNWSYRDFEELANISRSTISAIINGKKADLDILVKISKALNVPLWRIMELAGYDLGVGQTADIINQRIVSLIAAVPELGPLLDELAAGDRGDIVAVLAYLESQRSVRQRLDRLAPAVEE